MTGSPPPLISVVIPTYNRARLLSEAIDSVLQQSCSSYEVIVVDDGSTDDTVQLVQRYGGPVRYVRTSHGGVAHARNIGVRHARGKYLTFLDSDDLLYPYALELQAQLLDRFPDAALVCAEMSGFDDSGYFDRYHLRRYHQSAYRDPAMTYDRIFAPGRPLIDAVDLPAALEQHDPTARDRQVHVGNVFDTYLLNLVLCQNTMMLRREVADAVGERNTAVRHWQEVDYLLRITRRHTVCFVDVPTYRLRYHQGQVSSTSGPDGTYRWMRKQQILLRVVKRHALIDPRYYHDHRAIIDRHLARLHRAVAVPMLVCPGSPAARHRYTRCARIYLERCRRLGHPERVLQLVAATPAPLRRLAVGLIEPARSLGRSVMERLTTRTAAVLALFTTERAYT